MKNEMIKEPVKGSGKYKQTEIGLIPEDWEIKVLDKEIDLLTGYPFPSNKYSETGIRLLRGSNVKRGQTDWSENITQYWEQITAELKMYLLKEGDIVIAMDGSLVGKSFARLSKTDIPALLLQRVARVRSNKIDLGYLKEFICSDYFTKYCDSVKTVSAIPHISPDDIRNFKIPLPPTKSEQTAIAEALSDADAMIASLEKLIEKKKKIKQGAMQELLSPTDSNGKMKKGWVKKKLGEIIRLQGGYAFKSNSFIEDGVSIIRISDVGEGVVSLDNCVRYEEFNIPNEFIVSLGDVLIAMSGATTGKIGVYRKNEKAYINQRVGKFIVIDTKKTSLEFISHFLISDKFKNRLTKEIAQGAQPNISGKQIESIEIDMPTYLFEQIEIAKILTDMDNEITSKVKKLSKSKMFKQGMMQNLLTGKIRLV